MKILFNFIISLHFCSVTVTLYLESLGCVSIFPCLLVGFLHDYVMKSSHHIINYILKILLCFLLGLWNKQQKKKKRFAAPGGD